MWASTSIHEFIWGSLVESLNWHKYKTSSRLSPKNLLGVWCLHWSGVQVIERGSAVHMVAWVTTQLRELRVSWGDGKYPPSELTVPWKIPACWWYLALKKRWKTHGYVSLLEGRYDSSIYMRIMRVVQNSGIHLAVKTPTFIIISKLESDHPQEERYSTQIHCIFGNIPCITGRMVASCCINLYGLYVGNFHCDQTAEENPQLGRILHPQRVSSRVLTFLG